MSNMQLPTLAEVRPEVAAFARLMEFELRKHDGDWGNGWKDSDPYAALERLLTEARELRAAIHQLRLADPQRVSAPLLKQLTVDVGLECADVANFAMMIADMAGALEPIGEPAAFREWCAKLASDSIEAFLAGEQATIQVGPATWWNGELCQVRRGLAVVADDPRFPLYWAKEEGLIGQTIRAVEVVYDGQAFYLDDRNGSGWAKVTVGRGSPQYGHSEIAVSDFTELA
jgi:NTP pyrophosphatase (non-canonical NTP hydrolase)